VNVCEKEGENAHGRFRMGKLWEAVRTGQRERERERETAFCFTGLETGSLKLWFEDVRR